MTPDKTPDATTEPEEIAAGAEPGAEAPPEDGDVDVATKPTKPRKAKKSPAKKGLEARLEKLPRKGLSKEERLRRREMQENLIADPLLGTAAKQRKPVQIGLGMIAELENVRPTYHGIEKLAESVKEVGLIHALIIRPAKQRKLSEKGREARTEAEKIVKQREDYRLENDVPDKLSNDELDWPEELKLTSAQLELLKYHEKPYELVAGYRRKRAMELLGWEKAPAYVGDYTEQEVMELMMSENTQRENLSPIAEARSMLRLIELFGLTHQEVAQRLGVDRSHVSHRLGLLNLAAPVQEMIDEGKLTASHGEVLQVLAPEQQEKYAEKALTSEIGVGKLTTWVREIKEGKPNPLDQLAVESQLEPHEITQINGIVLKKDLEEVDFKRMLLYGAMRNFNDQQVVYLVEDEHGVPYENIWDYVRTLDEEAVDKFLKLMAVRYVVAGHRTPSLERTLLDDLAIEDADAGTSIDPVDARKINEALEMALAPEELEFDPNYHSIRIFPPEYQKPEDDEIDAEEHDLDLDDDEDLSF